MVLSLAAGESLEVGFHSPRAKHSFPHSVLPQVLARRMRVEQLLLWSLNAVMSDGSVGVDRPDRMSCGLTTSAASSGVCLPEGMVVWLGRYVVPRKNESLAALCGRYQCTAGVGLRLTTFSVSNDFF